MEKESLSILVVDPRVADHQMIRDSLHRSKVPATIHFVTSTAKGLREIEKRRFDLILTDHSLPEANAFHLLLELQQMHLPIPIVMLTDDGEARVAREAFQRGVDDYLLKEELQAISLFDVVGNVIERRRQKEEQLKTELLLRERAERDGLTGLYNHCYFVEALEKEFARARRYRRPLSLMMTDLDGFKAINDTCGHPQGDEVLRRISRMLLQIVRFVDVVARYGGDEFAIILPETNLKAASKLGERIVSEVRKNPFLHEGKIFPLSVSVGIAEFRSDYASPGQLLKTTDKALYEAKKRGRDRIVTAAATRSERGGERRIYSARAPERAIS